MLRTPNVPISISCFYIRSEVYAGKHLLRAFFIHNYLKQSDALWCSGFKFYFLICYYDGRND
jgi:hypothetical protein